ncbi:hypothetical protein KP24_06180 [Pectobacterium atrosepticum]|uniref:hypothetical protein n=1 Tax=Pectobacterium atrosepticum TaxID=29471 RepID=UPI000501A8FC|nr:hypothetical protein [Pectobacterium atrosepticum]KFX24640.1 hypothetical protein KP24_06180 [Pectobacterium atrosepticum]
MDVVKNYNFLFDQSKRVFDEMLSKLGHQDLLTSHNYLLDYDKLLAAINDRPEAAVLNLAVKEYQFALYALCSGQYRYAFGGLRLFFELMLSVVQFSAHEIDYHLWSKNKKDINWTALKNTENGIFSINFIRAFNPELADSGKQYSAIAESVYRECSEFVHGNALTHQNLPEGISFHEEAFSAWHKKSSIMRFAIIFAFSSRYLNHIEPQKMLIIEPVIMDVLGHLQPIQYAFSKSHEEL